MASVEALRQRSFSETLTTVPTVYCFTANVAGNLAVVENLLPPGAAAHDYQFTFAERRKLERAQALGIKVIDEQQFLEMTGGRTA